MSGSMARLMRAVGRLEKCMGTDSFSGTMEGYFTKVNTKMI